MCIRDRFDIGTLKDGYTLRVRANADEPHGIIGQPVPPFYMSGTGAVSYTHLRYYYNEPGAGNRPGQEMVSRLIRKL